MIAALSATGAGILLAVLWLAMIAYWRWLGEQGERRHAAESFEADFIPEAADVAAQELALWEAQILAEVDAELDQAEAERQRINRDVRQALQ